MLMRPFSISATDCAEYMIYGLLRVEKRTGAYFVDNKANPALNSRYYGNTQVRQQVWDHAVEVTGVSGN
jgi:hypothetical protein